MPEFRQTQKQREIVEAILKAADAGREASLEDLRLALSYGMNVSKQAIRSSLKYLTLHGFVEQRREGLYTFYKPTLEAYTVFRRSM